MELLPQLGLTGNDLPCRATGSQVTNFVSSDKFCHKKNGASERDTIKKESKK